MTIKAQINEIRDAPSKQMRAYRKRQAITGLVLEHLKSNGTFFHTSVGLFYFAKENAPKLYPILHDSQALYCFLCDRYGMNPAERSEFQHLIAALITEAELRGQRVNVHQLAHYDVGTQTLYVSRFDGNMYKLDGSEIWLEHNGTDEVFFWDDPHWNPFEITSDSNDHGNVFERLVLHSANFTHSNALSSADQRWILKKWFLATFFSSIHPTKPLLLVCGEKGGGKSLALRKWIKLVFGEGCDLSALERSKPDGFVATITSQPVAVFDNVDEHVHWLPDHLAQLATGIEFSRRRYYTTNEQVRFTPCCWVGLTSRTPVFIENRDDVLDRTLILHTERRTTFASEGDLLLGISTNRNLLWTELIRELNKIVKHFRALGHETAEADSRMADFATFVMRVAQLENEETRAVRILAQLENKQTEMLFQSDPLSECLAVWADKLENQGRKVNSAELNKELQSIAETIPVHWPYKSPNSLAQRLKNIRANLVNRFKIELGRNSSNSVWYQLWPLEQGKLSH